MMLNMDHPRHTRLRRILQPVFTPRSIERLRESVTQNALDIGEALHGELDLVTAVSAEMPLRVLADLFGMPREDRHLIFDWSNARSEEHTSELQSLMRISYAVFCLK